MEQETINLLIGAGLGFFISVLLSIINNFIQRRNDTRERSYQIVLERINQLEEYSRKVALTLGKNFCGA